MHSADALLTSEQRAMVEAIDQVCATTATDELKLAWDREQRFPHEAMDALAEAGWASLAVSQEHGGAGASAADLAVVHEALGRHSLVLAQTYFSLWVLGAEAISRVGTDEQKKEWLPRIAEGKALVAFAMTEPGTGSDARAMTSRARPEGDGFLVTGQKTFITGAMVSDVIITAVRTEESGAPRISLVMIDPKAPGVSIRPIAKIGLKALDLCEVFLDDVRIGAADFLGPMHGGWDVLRTGLAKERLFLAALSVGAHCDVLERSIEYATMRTTFGEPIGNRQMISSKITRMLADMESARGLVRRAAQFVDGNLPGANEASSLAKWIATEYYVSAAREGSQIFGGYGFAEEYAVARHVRDCKYLEVGGGSSEIQQIVLGRSLGLRP
jgi:alkylation response protein AidB-like acyl-CoA dehydrogenase